MYLPGQNHDVLLIEDNSDLREAMTLLLQMMGCNVTAAKDGRQGLHFLKNMHDLPCLIFLDLMMPVMDGWTFLEERQKNAHLAAVPVIVMSAAIEQNASVPGAVMCLQKPVNYAQLARSIEEIC